MNTNDRRRFLQTFAFSLAGAASPWAPGVFAQTLTQTAPPGEGPFYPDKMPSIRITIC